MHRSLAWLALALLACSGGGSASQRLRGSSATPGLGANEVAAARIELAACRGKLSDDDVLRALEIVEDFRTSAREMIVCGNILFAFVGTIATAVVGRNPKTALKFDPAAARYRAGAPDGFAGAAMDVAIKLDAEYTFGKRGDAVAVDLLDPKSFLVGMTPTVDAGGKLAIAFTSPGPVVELLGQGASPVSPIAVDKSVLAKLTAELDRLVVEGHIGVIDTRGSTSTRYDLRVPAAPIGDLRSRLRSTPMPFDAGGVLRQDLGQRLVIDRWDVRYVDNIKGLDGDIEFHAEGGPLSFAGTFRYRQSAEPEISIRCR